MGIIDLFTKTTCDSCGKKVGLFGCRLTDGHALCSECKDKMYYTPGFLSSIEWNVKLEARDVTFQQYNEFVAMRQKNLEDLQDFNATISLCGTVHLDEDAQELVFVDEDIFNNKAKLYAANPPVFKMKDFAMGRITTSEIRTSETMTGKAKAECTVYLVIGFEDPIYDVLRVKIGERKAKEGFFTDKVTESPDIQVLKNKLEDMLNWETAISNEEGTDNAITSMDSYWRMVSRARVKNYMTSDEVTDCLKEHYGRDKATIREVRKIYGL